MERLEQQLLQLQIQDIPFHDGAMDQSLTQELTDQSVHELP